jgi:transcription elongation factor Elf1
MAKNKCPICSARLSSKLVSKNSKLTKINCNRCGWHRVDKLDIIDLVIP